MVCQRVKLLSNFSVRLHPRDITATSGALLLLIFLLYRQRYLDLIVSDETRATFKARSKVISALRRHLEDRGFLEVCLYSIVHGICSRQ